MYGSMRVYPNLQFIRFYPFDELLYAILNHLLVLSSFHFGDHVFFKIIFRFTVRQVKKSPHPPFTKGGRRGVSFLYQLICKSIEADTYKNSNFFCLLKRLIKFKKTARFEKAHKHVKEAGVLFDGYFESIKKGLVWFVGEKGQICNHGLMFYSILFKHTVRYQDY